MYVISFIMVISGFSVSYSWLWLLWLLNIISVISGSRDWCSCISSMNSYDYGCRCCLGVGVLGVGVFIGCCCFG